MPACLQLTSWLSSAGGGIPPVIHALAAEHRHQHVDCLVAGIDDPTGKPPALPPEWPVVTGRVVGPAAFGYSPELARRLRQQVQIRSVIHVHGLWMYPGWLARKLSAECKAARIISPHGMLAPWALNNSRWKKNLGAVAFEKQNLRTASCLHALSAAEANDMRQYGLTNPIAILPNGMNLPISPNDESPVPDWSRQVAKNQKILLYLGRLHPKKGLVSLLKAWARLKKKKGIPDWTLVIAGWDQVSHLKELQELAVGLKVLSSVIFPGPQYGAAKSACYRACDAFILPSFSEGLPMVVLEAWSYGKPVLMTPECHLPQGFESQAALRVEANVESLAEGLLQLSKMPEVDRETMGRNGLVLVQNRFAWSKIAAQMRSVYAWMLDGGLPPECVKTT